jgi:hypoxanthine phosphoribosyltransferase
VEADIERILISAPEIQARVRAMGSAISRDYAGRTPHLVGVLKGIVYLFSDLARAITIPLSLDLIAISRYGPATAHTGAVRLLKDLDRDIAGRHVILVEDVVDTGLTLSHILKNLRVRRPASLVVCTLFDRPQQRLVDVPVLYKGFDLPDCFVVGYGMDYEENYRNLPFVGVLKEEIIGVKQNCD